MTVFMMKSSESVAAAQEKAGPVRLASLRPPPRPNASKARKEGGNGTLVLVVL